MERLSDLMFISAEGPELEEFIPDETVWHVDGKQEEEIRAARPARMVGGH